MILCTIINLLFNIFFYLFSVKTRNVDHTITNILEGDVPFTPEIVEAQPSPSTSRVEPQKSTPTSNTMSKAKPNSTLSTAAPSFPKSPHERALSFQERKQQLIENARRKYIEKHGLTHLL